MPTLLMLCLCAACCCVALVHGKSRETDPEYGQIMRVVDQLRAQVQGAKASNPLAWGQLALHLQAADVRYHADSSTMQPEALHAFERACELSGEDEVAFRMRLTHRKGLLLKMMSRGEEAVEAHRWVLQQSTFAIDKAASLQALGDALSMLGRLPEAIEAFEEAVAVHPTGFATYISLVEAYLEAGGRSPEQWAALYEQIEGTIARYESGEEDPGHVQDEDEGRSVLDEEVSEGHRPVVPGSAYWALFLIGDKLQDHERAWGYLERAHGWVQATRPNKLNVDEVERQAQGVLDIFRPGFWPNPQTSGVGVPSRVPIFVVGMMRSGSTLTETMLDAHSEIWGMGEDSVFNSQLSAMRDDIVAASIADGEDAVELHRRAAQTGTSPLPATAKVVKRHGTAIVRKMVAKAKNDTSAAKPKSKDKGDGNEGNGEVEAEVGSDGSVSKSSKRTKGSKGRSPRHVVDKMLFNYRNIGFIHMVFPNATIVHTMRDPMDTLWSCFKHKFDDSGLEWSMDAEELALQYFLYLKIMHHFRVALPGRVIDVQYEQLVHRPEEVMRSLVERISGGDDKGIQWEDSILSFHSSKRIVHTHSQSQVRQGLYSKSIGGWRKYSKQLAPLIAAMKKHLKKLQRLPDAHLALPYADSINWELDPLWPQYETLGQPVPEPSPRYQGKPIVGREPPGRKSSSNSAAKSKRVPAKPTSAAKKSLAKAPAGAPSSAPAKTVAQGKRELKAMAKSGATKAAKAGSEKKAARSKGKKEKGKKAKKAKKFKKTKKLKDKAGRKSTEKAKTKGKKSTKKTSKKGVADPVAAVQSMGPRDLMTPSGRVTMSKQLQGQLEALLDQVVKQARLQSRDRVKQLASTFRTNGFRNDLLDELTAVSYYLVNSRQFAEAVQVFGAVDGLLKTMGKDKGKGKGGRNEVEVPPSAAMLLGWGTALAQISKLDEAQKVLTRLVALNKLRMKAAVAAVNTEPAGRSILRSVSVDTIDALNRRGEVLAARGNEDAAMRDYDDAIALLERDRSLINEGHAHLYLARGIVWYQRAFYTRSLPDLQMAAKLEPTNHKTQIWIGKCLKEFADTEGSVAAHDRSLALQPTGNREALMEKAIALLEVSRWQEATAIIDEVLKIDPGHKLAWGYLGLMYISMGRHTDALKNFDRTLKVDAKDTTVMQMAGVCLVGEGRFRQAVDVFDRALRLSPQHTIWFLREQAYSLWMVLDLPTLVYYPDRTLAPQVSEELSQQNNWEQLVAVGYPPLADTKLAAKLRKSVKVGGPSNGISGSFVMTPAIAAVVNATMPLSQWIQLRSPGFLPNTRQHRMFGVSALHMAQLMRMHCLLQMRYGSEAGGELTAFRRRVGGGVVMPDAASSDRRYPDDFSYLRATEDPEWYAERYGGFPKPGDASTVLSATLDGTFYDEDAAIDLTGVAGAVEDAAGFVVPPHYHRLTWRDMMDVAVRWRKLSEPRDLVLWIDRLPLAQKGGRLGLSTPLLSGVFKNHRYHTYHDMGVAVVGKVLADSGMFWNADNYDMRMSISNAQRRAAAEATTVEQLYEAVGRRNISILAPCDSSKYPGKVLNGTRILAQKAEKEGWDLMISTPSTTDRYVHYEEELAYVFEEITLPHLKRFLHLSQRLEDGGVGAAEEEELREELERAKLGVIHGGLKTFFYWVHFAPLSRGTSATGYAVIVAHLLAVGESMVDAVPVRKQLDFEGMFRSSPDEFVAAVYPWIVNRRRTTVPRPLLDGDKGHRLFDIFNTSRAMTSIFIAQPGEEDYNRTYTF